MTGRASAYAALGLEPGADSAAVEQAYKRLIKQYHPDREGGDGSRAAEIIHAYRLLRGGKSLVDPLQFNEHRLAQRKGGWRWPLAAGIVLAGAAAVTLVPQRTVSLNLPVWLAGPEMSVKAQGFAGTKRERMDEALHLRAIDAAVREAVEIHRTKDEMALARASRDCHNRLRANPSTRQFDRCAAFDNAVVGLEDRDPLRDGGPFAPLAVTGRQWSAASALSADYLAIDSRMDMIRLRVELALTPRVEPPAPVKQD